MEMPMKRLMRMLMIGPLLPTAARACDDEKWPTTATSIALNDCCNTPLAISGSEKISIFLAMPPWSMSIFADVFSDVMPVPW